MFLRVENTRIWYVWPALFYFQRKTLFVQSTFCLFPISNTSTSASTVVEEWASRIKKMITLNASQRLAEEWVNSRHCYRARLKYGDLFWFLNCVGKTGLRWLKMDSKRIKKGEKYLPPFFLPPVYGPPVSDDAGWNTRPFAGAAKKWKVPKEERKTYVPKLPSTLNFELFRPVNPLRLAVCVCEVALFGKQRKKNPQSTLAI